MPYLGATAPVPLPIPRLLDFETTEVHDSADVVGQSRALDAVRFGIDIDNRIQSLRA
ncbi:MAG: hypothetical protein M5R42_12760 [Rhodocyclaceae bacterium]|nr:hypothetical protein [Rhodocyclaceae bacterium]